MSLADLLRLAIQLLDTELFELAGTTVTPLTLLTVATIVGVSFYLSSMFQRLVGHSLRSRGVEDEGTVGVLQRLLHYAVIVVGLGVALQTVGIKLGALFAAGAVFAVGIGFAMQNIAQNFVSGIILLVERSIKPGDVLRVEGRMVRVKRMNIRSTIVRTRDGEDLIVPNALLVQGTVTNATLRRNAYRVRARVGVHYGSDMRQVRATLEQVPQQLSWRLAGHPRYEPRVLLLDFADSAVTWELAVWTDDPWDERAALSSLREAIWNAFKDMGITIAFPQVDLHLDSPVVEALRSGPRLAG